MWSDRWWIGIISLDSDGVGAGVGAGAGGGLGLELRNEQSYNGSQPTGFQ